MQEPNLFSPVMSEEEPARQSPRVIVATFTTNAIHFVKCDPEKYAIVSFTSEVSPLRSWHGGLKEIEKAPGCQSKGEDGRLV